MMSSEKILESVIKNRDRIIKKRKKTQKITSALCLCLAVVLTTGGAMYAANRSEDPYIPGGDRGDLIVATDETGVSSTGSDGVTDTDEPISTAPNDGTSGIPPGNTDANGKFYMGERLLVYAPDYFFSADTSNLPATLPVYTLDMEKSQFSDELYADYDAKLLEFIELLYGRDVMLEGKDDKSRHLICSFDPKDPYIAANKSGSTTIGANSAGGYIHIPIDVTAVEDYREMSIDEALEYVTNSDYFKAALQYLGIDSYDTVAHREYYASNINYTFEFTEGSEDIKQYVENRLYRSIDVYVQIAPESESIRVEYEINLPSTYTEYTLLDTVSYEEALEQAKRYVNAECSKEDVKVSVKYDEYHWDYFAGSDERFYAPYYVFYFGMDGEDNSYVNHSNYDEIMVKGFKTPDIQEVIQTEE